MGNSNLRIFPDQSQVNPGIEKLSSFIQFTKQNNIALKVFVNPYHSSYLHIINDSGRWLSYVEWKQNIASIALQSEIPFYDFGYFSDYAMESVPVKENHLQMEWFWEPAHYKASLGEKMLQTLMSAGEHPASFGLTAEQVLKSLNHELEKLKESRNQWKDLRTELFPG